MLETTLAGSMPKPAWLAEPMKLWAAWRLEGALLAEGKRDAVLACLKRQEDAGVDIVTDGEQSRHHFVHGFLVGLAGLDFEHKRTIGIRKDRCKAEAPVVTGAVKRTTPVHGDEVRFLRQSEDVFPLLAKSKIDQVSLECANSKVPIELLGLLKGNDVLVGTIDVANEIAETPEQVAATIRSAMKHAPAEHLYPCTNCGMAPMEAGLAWRKVEALAKGAAIVRKELGARCGHAAKAACRRPRWFVGVRGQAKPR